MSVAVGVCVSSGVFVSVGVLVGVFVDVGVLVTSQAAVRAAGGVTRMAVFFLAGFPLVAETGTLTNDRSRPESRHDTPKI
jgi:hypothetical protein